ncbi:MAG: tetratricopeptide repeat protein [Methanomassiliicoccales archaeon]
MDKRPAGRRGLGIFIMVFRSKDLFLPDEMEDAKIKKMSGPTIRSVAECPTCHDVVEVGWDSFPYCGTKLPIICGNCGTELGEMDSHCPDCGTPVEGLEAVDQTTHSLRSALEDDEAPETRAGRLGKLGDAYLKKGDKEEALGSYRRAMEETRYARKKTFFMVKQATVLKNMGKGDQALEILEEALEMDPEDYAGAGQVRNGIHLPSKGREEERGTTV